MYRCSSASSLPDAVVYKEGLMDLRLKVHLTHQPHLLALAADFVLDMLTCAEVC